MVECSGEVNRNEKAEFAIDGNKGTKWCDVSVSPNYVVFDLGEPKEMSKWILTNAGGESAGYITSDCYLQGSDSPDGKWTTLDRVTENRRNVIQRTFKSAKYRYVRLLVTRPGQSAAENAARIYEVELY